MSHVRSYDHRIREIVCETGNPRIFQHLRIPRSTTASWLSRGCRSVVSLYWHHDIASVLDENEKLKRRTERQSAIIRLLVVLLKVSGFRHMPHHAFVGQTPDEVCFDQADRVRDRLTAVERQARRRRMEANRAQSCRVCGPPSTRQSVSVVNAVVKALP